METYLLLADVCFDWSMGEYGTQDVNNVLLGTAEFENDDDAREFAYKLFDAYCENNTYAVKHDSYVKFRKL